VAQQKQATYYEHLSLLVDKQKSTITKNRDGKRQHYLLGRFVYSEHDSFHAMFAQQPPYGVEKTTHHVEQLPAFFLVHELVYGRKHF